ncbi:TetR/AcrR family transcriptional regulator [Campylobacter geochelonis]|uniref:Transcription regulator protein n=1 Tax=Campylobacter geochelonis TaxID=1780362 RepID=A0A128EE46_9BACT|nr:TetR/AcrR family transcriptional regulator [Campylobacter geochelonis]QKF70507.1 transcriptional regulator, TetR/AcrR family [Campylobacter geochelonis]CZE46145.1 transcription regulator protein [Campylobacter geochelonis]CZE46488.1 transcription regulator protein [Campylobacter geochelonis]CZE50451.1 transcription regulator protein [Campylobacter geochelonis]
MLPKPSSKKALDRYEKILSAGLELFLEKGYQNTSLSDLVEKSGGSLSTIYKYFENKEGLFKAIITNGVSKLSANMDKKINLNANLSLEEFLYEFADFYLSSIFSKKSLLFHKLILSEGFRKDDDKEYIVGKLFYEEAILSVNIRLVNFFKKNEQMSKFSDKELKNFAMFFTYIIKEPYFFEYILFDKKIECSKKDKKEHIQRSISIFLNGILG